MNLHGRNPSRHAPDVAVGVGGVAVVLDDPAGVLGHEEVRLARRHRSPGSHDAVGLDRIDRSQLLTFLLSPSILSVGGSSLSGPGRQKEEDSYVIIDHLQVDYG